MRTNPKMPTALTTVSDKAMNRVKGKSEFAKRLRDLHEALPPVNDLWDRPTYDGAELRPCSTRAGSMDFKSKPSRGLT
jgi:hypothetical protein